ncbi:MAG: hypothetical protein LBV60_05910 [Streptomyces sp.]|jgi:hypothetical protein|nr:hypothetical protein [Streptomyces sp.]
MTPPTAIAPPREPVMLTLSPRPPATPATMPLALTATPIGPDEIQIIADLDAAAEGAKCSCSAGDDQPY